MTPEPKPTERKYAHVLRPLTSDERNGLRTWLQRDGLRDPLVLDQHGDLLDGHHREELCSELGIAIHYRSVTTDDPINWIKSNQKARRNLNREEMRALIAEQIEATPYLSNRAIAKVVGVSDPTVGAVRRGMVEEGKIDNVVRFEVDGKVARGNRNAKFSHSDEDEPSEKPVSRVRKKLAAEPPKLKINDGGRVFGLFENIVHHFADDNEFHAVPVMIKTLDPDGSLKLDVEQVGKSLRRMALMRDVRVETRPAAKNTKRYRIYRQDRLIGLSVLKTKFRPVIEYLKEEAQRPISHQTTVRFTTAAGLLIQLLRDLEAE